MLRRKGYSEKYDRPGIYCIRLDGQMVYIGKSLNMLERIAWHYVGIKEESEKKYQIIAQAEKAGKTVGFDVLYYASSQSRDDIIEEIGHMEGVFIRQYHPLLNAQIPKAEDWRHWKIKEVNEKEALRLLLGEEKVEG